MTPEEAQELRKRATPGPWERHPDNPRMLCNLDRKFAVHAELVKNRGLEPDPDDVANTELIAAAPALAELVAELKREYALLVPVETGVPGEPVWKYFVRKHEDGAAIVTAYPTIARWFEEGDDLALFARMNSIPTYRIVQRLTGNPEAVNK